MERIDEPEYPVNAVREALVNALSHRDYSSPGGSVTLTIYDDRIEIINTGLLPEGITLSELTKPHASHPRNPVIAGAFYRHGLVEGMGMGIQQIMNICEDADMKPPEFFEQAGAFVIRLWSRAYKREEQPVISPDSSDLSARQEEILALLSVESLAATEILLKLGCKVTNRTLQRDLQYLKEKGYVNVRGETWKAEWFIVK